MIFNNLSLERINLEMNSFYGYINITDFKSINKEKIENIKTNSKKINNYFMAKDGTSKSLKYLKIMNKIKTCPKNFNISNDKAEVYFLFMFSIDPTFEIAKIYLSENKIQEIKKQISNKFGIYDKNLIRLEKMFIEHFLEKEEKEILDNEIVERSFK